MPESPYGVRNMRILHIINDAPSDLSRSMIEAQSRDHEVTVIELGKKELSYDSVIDQIFSHDKVVSW